jgi:hypothetical protein
MGKGPREPDVCCQGQEGPDDIFPWCNLLMHEELVRNSLWGVGSHRNGTVKSCSGCVGAP